MSNNPFWKWSNGVESTDSKLILEGVIASEDWWGDGLDVTPVAFREELNKRSGDLVVSLNSPGGDVFAGVSIYNSLVQYKGNVVIEVNGLAASIASVIAMAGDKVVMLPGSSMMIHKPWSGGIGNADELEKVIDSLNKIEESIVPIYIGRTGLSEDRIKEMLADETWLTPAEAVELGFADEMVEAKKKIGISDSIKNALNGQFAFSMSATRKATQLLVDKIKQEVEETDVTDTTETTDEAVVEPAEGTTADESTVEETETEAEEVTETPAEEISNSVKKEQVKMSKTDEIAKDQILPEAQAKVEVKTPSVKDYVASNEGLEAFANLMQKVGESNAGERAGQALKKEWGKHLATKMGITNPTVLLPPAVIQSIEDAFKEGGEIWNLVNKTGLDVYAAAYDTVTGENSRAKGYNREVEETKDEEVITLASRTLRPQFVYKYLTLPREVVKENRSTGALLTYVLSELPRRIIRELERAIVTGDGRTAGTKNKVNEGSPNGFYNIKTDAAGGIYANQYTPDVSEGNYEALVRARSMVKADGAKWLIAKAEFVSDTLLEQGVNGGYLFTPGTNVSQVFGFAGVITPDWMDDDTDNDAYIFVPSQYRTVGDATIESFTNFELSTNTNEYLQEVWAGGGLTALDSAVAIGAGVSS